MRFKYDFYCEEFDMDITLTDYFESQYCIHCKIDCKKE